MTQRRIYQCRSPYFVTFNVLNGEWLFEDEEKARMLHEIILWAAEMKNHRVYQFCIMPNHVHLLCQTMGTHCGYGPAYDRGLENPLCGEVDGGHINIEQITTPNLNNSIGGTVGLGNAGFLTRDDGSAARDATPKILGPIPKSRDATLSDFIQSIRGTFSRQIHMGQLWHPRFHDRIIRNEEQLESTIRYITQNPIKAGLAEKWRTQPYQYLNADLIAQTSGIQTTQAA